MNGPKAPFFEFGVGTAVPLTPYFLALPFIPPHSILACVAPATFNSILSHSGLPVVAIFLSGAQTKRPGNY